MTRADLEKRKVRGTASARQVRPTKLSHTTLQEYAGDTDKLMQVPEAPMSAHLTKAIPQRPAAKRTGSI